MSQKHSQNEKQATKPMDQEKVENMQEETTNLQDEQPKEAEETAATDKVADELAELQKKYDELNDTHLRLRAEFDNYRKRTLREKSELIKNGGESALTHLLPVVDYLTSQGVKAMDIVGKPFDADICEAIATIPAPEEGQKGKVIDCVQTGYMLNDKVLRHAKVVVGE